MNGPVWMVVFATTLQVAWSFTAPHARPIHHRRPARIDAWLAETPGCCDSALCPVATRTGSVHL